LVSRQPVSRRIKVDRYLPPQTSTCSYPFCLGSLLMLRATATDFAACSLTRLGRSRAHTTSGCRKHPAAARVSCSSLWEEAVVKRGSGTARIRKTTLVGQQRCTRRRAFATRRMTSRQSHGAPRAATLGRCADATRGRSNRRRSTETRPRSGAGRLRASQSGRDIVYA
jgi:hypothetical protein